MAAVGTVAARSRSVGGAAAIGATAAAARTAGSRRLADCLRAIQAEYQVERGWNQLNKHENERIERRDRVATSHLQRRRTMKKEMCV